jgi:hypothetical protein
LVAEIDVRTTSEAEGRALSGRGWAFQVTVSEGGSQTVHQVTLASEAYERLAGGACGPDELVRRSFDYLLEREPKESILREFDIMVIARYFPEYEGEIARRVRP